MTADNMMIDEIIADEKYVSKMPVNTDKMTVY
jgi:hypothetical protein